MKKFNLVITALLILSVAAFAVDVEPSATVSGEASVTFTYDLDAEAFDIANDASAELDVVFIANTSVEEGEGDVVGYIQISGISSASRTSMVVPVASLPTQMMTASKYLLLST
jgi:hypothetical protein